MHKWQIDYVEQVKTPHPTGFVGAFIWSRVEDGYEVIDAPTAADALTMWRENAESSDDRRECQRSAHDPPRRKWFVSIKVVAPDASTTG